MADPKNPSSSSSSQADKASADNRSKQMNSQDSTYYRSRGESEDTSTQKAGETTRGNQEKGK